MDKFFDYSLNLETRTLTFFEEVTKASCERIIKQLHILDNHKDGTVTILMNSEGGCVSSGLAIYDAIRAMKNYVRIIVVGECCSIDTVILQAADERLLYPNAYLMLHYGNRTVEGHVKDTQVWMKYYDDMDEICFNIYLEVVNNRQRFNKKKLIKINDLKSSMEFDKILLADKAVKSGYADRIIEGSY